MGVWYVTREKLKVVLDAKATAYSNRVIDQAIETGSRNVEGLLHRRYYPQQDTRLFDFPNYSYAPVWQMWLDQNELISITTLTAEGVVIPGTDYILRRADGRSEPPYTILEISLASKSMFTTGTTFQQATSIAGLFGYRDDQLITTATVVTTVNSSATLLDVTDSTEIGTGSVIIVDTERMTVTKRDLLTTGTTLTDNSVTANANAVNFPVSDGTKHHQDELIYIDAEAMIVRQVAGNTLTVQRAQDGSVLAAHTSGATIFAPRHLTVTRAALGSTAAGHNSGAVINVQQYPGPVETLATAYAINQRLQQQAGYARTAGTADYQKEFTGRGITSLEQDAIQSVGRSIRARVGAI